MMRHGSALQVAVSLMAHLRPACTRIEIAGSIRRGKAEVKDIELVAVPDLMPVPRERPEFGKPIPPVYKTQLEKMLMEMRDDGAVQFTKWGERYKQLYLKYAGIAVDLFLVLPPAQWGVQMVIRTGPAEFGHWLVTRRCKGGGLPDHLIVQDGVVGERVMGAKGFERQGQISTPEEIDFLNLCGLGWIEPKDRVARWDRTPIALRALPPNDPSKSTQDNLGEE